MDYEDELPIDPEDEEKCAQERRRLDEIEAMAKKLLKSCFYWRDTRRTGPTTDEPGPSSLPSLEHLQAQIWSLFDRDRELAQATRRAQAHTDFSVPSASPSPLAIVPMHRESLKQLQDRFKQAQQVVKDLLTTGAYWRELRQQQAQARAPPPPVPVSSTAVPAVTVPAVQSPPPTATTSTSTFTITQTSPHPAANTNISISINTGPAGAAAPAYRPVVEHPPTKKASRNPFDSDDEQGESRSRGSSDAQSASSSESSRYHEDIQRRLKIREEKELEKRKQRERERQQAEVEERERRRRKEQRKATRLRISEGRGGNASAWGTRAGASYHEIPQDEEQGGGYGSMGPGVSALRLAAQTQEWADEHSTYIVDPTGSINRRGLGERALKSQSRCCGCSRRACVLLASFLVVLLLAAFLFAFWYFFRTGHFFNGGASEEPQLSQPQPGYATPTPAPSVASTPPVNSASKARVHHSRRADHDRYAPDAAVPG